MEGLGLVWGMGCVRRLRETYETPKPYPFQALLIHLRPFTPISGRPHPPKTISGPSHSSQALHAHLKPFTPISSTPCPFLAPPHSSLTFYTHPRPYTPVSDHPAARGMVLSAYKHAESANQSYIRVVKKLELSLILNQNI